MAMPKRQTADATPEATTAAEPRKKASTAKPKTAAAATHKRTSTPLQSKVVAEVAEVVAEPVASVPSVKSPRMPSHADIAALAYSLWEARGYQGGSPEEDWFLAERQLARVD